MLNRIVNNTVLLVLDEEEILFFLKTILGLEEAQPDEKKIKMEKLSTQYKDSEEFRPVHLLSNHLGG